MYQLKIRVFETLQGTGRVLLQKHYDRIKMLKKYLIYCNGF